jgi:hypothetical protein
MRPRELRAVRRDGRAPPDLPHTPEKETTVTRFFAAVFVLLLALYVFKVAQLFLSVPA